jgi:hypothetical protein
VLPEPMLTITPYFFSLIWGSTARVTFIVPKRLRPICFAQVSSFCSSSGTLSLCKIAPATLQRMSILPYVSMTFLTIASTSAFRVMSAPTAMELLPSFLTPSAVFSASSRSTSVTATVSHPSLAKSRAVSLPKPTWLPAPVTSATFPLKPRSILSSLTSGFP